MQTASQNNNATAGQKVHPCDILVNRGIVDSTKTEAFCSIFSNMENQNLRVALSEKTMYSYI